MFENDCKSFTTALHQHYGRKGTIELRFAVLN